MEAVPGGALALLLERQKEFKPAEFRIAVTLISLANGGDEVHISQRQLSDLTGLARQHVRDGVSGLNEKGVLNSEIGTPTEPSTHRLVLLGGYKTDPPPGHKTSPPRVQNVPTGGNFMCPPPNGKSATSGERFKEGARASLTHSVHSSRDSEAYRGCVSEAAPSSPSRAAEEIQNRLDTEFDCHVGPRDKAAVWHLVSLSREKFGGSIDKLFTYLVEKFGEKWERGKVFHLGALVDFACEDADKWLARGSRRKPPRQATTPARSASLPSPEEEIAQLEQYLEAFKDSPPDSPHIVSARKRLAQLRNGHTRAAAAGGIR